MALTSLHVLNPADKTRHYSVAMGEGTLAATDALVTDVKTYPLGSQFTNLTSKKFYVRTAVEGATTDWTEVGA